MPSSPIPHFFVLSALPVLLGLTALAPTAAWTEVAPGPLAGCDVRPRGVCPDTCFVAGTLILTADGTAQPIESLAPGDIVLADFCAGISPDAMQVGVNASELPCVGEARVTEAFVRHASELIHLRVSSPDTGSDGVLVGTPEHPFFLIEEAVFVEMGELRPGDLLTDPDGAALLVESVQREVGDFTVYNVGVEGAHDYFVVVGDGTEAVFVHNPRGCGDGGPGLPRTSSPRRTHRSLRRRPCLRGTRFA